MGSQANSICERSRGGAEGRRLFTGLYVTACVSFGCSLLVAVLPVLQFSEMQRQSDTVTEREADTL